MIDQKRKAKVNDNSGITLIALVISVIILIILAGISIGALTGQNGVIKNAQKAKIETEIAQYIDRVELARATVAIDNLGIVTLDNLIEQIYQDNIVPRGNITKLDEIQAKMVTVEGYEFIITADDIEYKGNSGEKGQVIPDLVEGMIEISKETWNPDTHTASVNITKGESVAEALEIQYQVNAYEEEGWVTGNFVNNLKHGDTVYARLWNGIRGGKDYASQEIKDGKNPKDAVITWTSATTLALGDDITASVVLRDDESGVNVANSKWELTTSSTTTVGLDASNYSGSFTGTSTTQTITTTKVDSGTYFLHVLTQDNAGNKIETIYQTGIIINQPVTGISLNKTSTTMPIGQTETLTATITPTTATNKNITWSSNNTEVATVSDGGIVTAKQLGKAIITATTQDGNKIASCTVSVVMLAQNLKAGDYIKYDTGVSSVGENGVITCRVLYPVDSEYGLQIISDKTVGEAFTLGGITWEEGKTAYNGAIERLNSEAQKYVNTNYAYDGRCVGSIPTVQNGMFVNKNKIRDSEGNIRDTIGTVTLPMSTWTSYTRPTGWTSDDTGCYNEDTNYIIDKTALEGANICSNTGWYWLASRYVYAAPMKNASEIRDAYGSLLR